jgi:C-terminal processing protease CtpA/Prc
LLGQARVFDGEIAYLRVGKVENRLAEALRETWDSLASTNKLKGLVLDLRYTGGGDYAAAAAAADLFTSKEKPLLNWGDGVVKSKEKTNALEWPVVALVNAQTSKGAEALAAVLRETGSGLVLGSRTAGLAMIAEEFPLKNGQRLRIATAPIQVGEGTALTADGLKPDITVVVNPEEERAYYADPFRMQSSVSTLASVDASAADAGNSTNRARRTRLNESELVRERREGASLDDERPPRRERGPEKPLVRDPALARALDLLKGLAVVRPPRS